MSTWEPELCDSHPDYPFEKVNGDLYIQRKDIHEVVYHSMDGTQEFKGYECYKRTLNYLEYLYERTHSINKSY